MTIRLLLVDDHAVIRSGLRMLMEHEADIEIVGEAGTVEAALAAVRQLRPDVVLMDIALPDGTGIEATQAIKRNWAGVAVVALTIHEDEEYFFPVTAQASTLAAPSPARGMSRRGRRPEQSLFPMLQAGASGSGPRRTGGQRQQGQNQQAGAPRDYRRQPVGPHVHAHRSSLDGLTVCILGVDYQDGQWNVSLVSNEIRPI